MENSESGKDQHRKAEDDGKPLIAVFWGVDREHACGAGSHACPTSRKLFFFFVDVGYAHIVTEASVANAIRIDAIVANRVVSQDPAAAG